MVTTKPMRPTEEEITINSRSKSAKLRVLEKLAVAA
jgi:16S rRNA C1402 N4-methylase RsmH